MIFGLDWRAFRMLALLLLLLTVSSLSLGLLVSHFIAASHMTRTVCSMDPAAFDVSTSKLNRRLSPALQTRHCRARRRPASQANASDTSDWDTLCPSCAACRIPPASTYSGAVCDEGWLLNRSDVVCGTLPASSNVQSISRDRAGRCDQHCAAHCAPCLTSSHYRHRDFRQPQGHCRGERTRLLSRGRIVIDKKNRVLCCAISKVASTTVKTAMARMLGVDAKSNALNVHNWDSMSAVGMDTVFVHREKIAQYVTRWRQKLIKFVVVRHPLARLVSAYRDKFELDNGFNEGFRQKFCRIIRNRYRAIADGHRLPANCTAGEVTFSEFVMFLTDEALDRTIRFDEHWSPQYELCHPCLVHYDYILHHETLDTELPALWQLVYPSAPRQRVFELQRLNQNPNSRSEAVVNEYLSQLSPELLRRLAHFYDTDFDMFGYSRTFHANPRD